MHNIADIFVYQFFPLQGIFSGATAAATKKLKITWWYT